MPIQCLPLARNPHVHYQTNQLHLLTNLALRYSPFKDGHLFFLFRVRSPHLVRSSRISYLPPLLTSYILIVRPRSGNSFLKLYETVLHVSTLQQNAQVLQGLPQCNCHWASTSIWERSLKFLSVFLFQKASQLGLQKTLVQFLTLQAKPFQ